MRTFILAIWLAAILPGRAADRGLYPMAHWFTNVAQATDAAAARTALGVGEGGSSTGVVAVAVSGSLLTATTNGGVVTLSGVPQTNGITSLAYSNANTVVFVHMLPGITNGFITQVEVNSSSNALYTLVLQQLTDGTNAVKAYALNATNDLAAALISMITQGTNAAVNYSQTATNDLYATLISRLTDGTNAVRNFALSATNDLNTTLTALINTASNSVYAAAVTMTNGLAREFAVLRQTLQTLTPVSQATNYTVTITNHFGAPMQHWFRLNADSNVFLSFAATATNAAASLSVRSSNAVIRSITFPTNAVELIPTNGATIVGTYWTLNFSNVMLFAIRTNEVLGTLEIGKAGQ